MNEKIAALMIGSEGENRRFGSSNIHALLSGMREYTQANGLELVSYLMSDIEGSIVDYCKRRKIENAILFGANYDSPNFEEWVVSPITSVTIDMPVDTFGSNKGSIVIDDYYYAKEATKRLITGGCKFIAMLSGHPHAYVSGQREQGYLDAIAEAGLDFCLVENGGFDDELAEDVTHELLKSYPQIDGFFCASDYMALGCHEVLTKMNIAIPQQISIFGFDGIVSSQMVYPAISTVKQDNYRKGYTAAQLLHTIMQTGGNCERRVMVPCSMMEGDSVKK